ncbi:hypothetical protein, partial [Mesorhizobium sp. M2C.T.Ca.TU.002.02.1.1]|uniref:hypothetical protein n=1 Tax=Mesorhizobium sp. M2C.T.Ca.TU.002.02.1.1 TaxID=2496788 RepID=UPI0019D2A0BF
LMEWRRFRTFATILPGTETELTAERLERFTVSTETANRSISLFLTQFQTEGYGEGAEPNCSQQLSRAAQG